MTAILVPYRVCFIEENDDENWQKLDIFFDCSFGFDMIMNFISAYYDNHNILRRKYRDIINRYLTGWFWIDAIAL